MKITENKKGRCTGCCAAALFAGLDGTYDFLLNGFIGRYGFIPASKLALNYVVHKKVMGACRKDCEVDSYV